MIMASTIEILVVEESCPESNLNHGAMNGRPQASNYMNAGSIYSFCSGETQFSKG